MAHALPQKNTTFGSQKPSNSIRHQRTTTHTRRKREHGI